MSKIRSLLGGAVCLAVAIGGYWLVINRQLVFDQVRVWQYRPDEAITRLAQRATMTDRAKFYFYLAHPRLEGASQFNQDCRRVEKASPIIGCYVQGKDTIHIYNVADQQLDGIKEVTAAHEMLHVAWSRYSAEQRARLSQLLEAAYQRVKTDKLAKRMAYYERAQPGSRANELHSILGTEFADLGDELERHYAGYIADRSALLRLHAHYNQQFEAAEAQAEALSAQLARRKSEIEQLTTRYLADVTTYSRQVEDFNTRAQANRFSSQAEFASERAALAATGKQLKHRQQTISQKIDAYNSAAEKLNALGRQIDQLNNSLDSQKAVQ